MPKMIPWVLGYLKNCNKKSMLHTAKYMHQILNLSLDAYDEIFQEFDITNLVEKKGIIYVWTNQNMKSRELEIKVRNDFGVKQKLLTTADGHKIKQGDQITIDGSTGKIIIGDIQLIQPKFSNEFKTILKSCRSNN